MRYSDLNLGLEKKATCDCTSSNVERGVRRHFDVDDDDITVPVVLHFLNTNLLSRASSLKNPCVFYPWWWHCCFTLETLKLGSFQLVVINIYQPKVCFASSVFIYLFGSLL